MTLPERRRAGGTGTLRRWDPWSEFDDLRERVSRIFEHGMGGFGLTSGWSPLVDVEETDDAYVLEADVPGIKAEDITIEVQANQLRISGEVRERQRSGVVRQQGRMTGDFEYRTTLPQEVDTDRIEANLEEGVLTVRVPKSEKAQPRKVEVRSRTTRAGSTVDGGSTP